MFLPCCLSLAVIVVVNASPYIGHYHGDHVVEEPLPSFNNFDASEETWCRGGRGRIIGGYQSEPVACAHICAEEPLCEGFNLRAVDGICAAYSHGCREDTNHEWTFFRKRKPTTDIEELMAEDELMMTTDIVEDKAKEQDDEKEKEGEVAVEEETTTETVTTEEMATTNATEEATPVETLTTEQEMESKDNETMAAVEVVEVVEETTTIEEQPTVAVTSAQPPTTSTSKRPMKDIVAAAMTVMNRKAPSGKQQFVDVENTQHIVAHTSKAVFGEYEPLKGNCRGGSILKMFVQLTAKQCAEACSSHCSCIGFTYADDR